MLERVKKDKVEFVSLQFCDLLGIPKEVIIPVGELEKALKDGIWFDGSSIEGFARIQESDQFLRPDESTYAIIPWMEEKGRTARIICDIYKPDGTPSNLDPRGVLKRVLREAEERGFEFNVGPELEFYLVVEDENGQIKPLDYSGYFDFSPHIGYKILKEINGALKHFGIVVEASHHEVGFGQYEIDFRYGNALDIADKVLTLKYTVKEIAQMYGIKATFMPKPFFGMNGSGMHTHMSLFDRENNRNAFYDYNEKDKYKLSKTAYQFLAGIISHVKAMTAILCPTVNSYKRLVAGYEAPVYISWACMNRSALIRVPQWFKTKPQSSRLELRCPDPSSNPYLAFAVMLKAGLDGIDKNMVPPEPVEENIYQMDEVERFEKNLKSLPHSLFEAIQEMEKDAVIKETLGKELFERYLQIKRREYDEFRIQVTKWEIDKYVDLF
ncbi:MAG: type I glutamate--ammonia ligase [Candidatus Neomarinimicrobiota bacterium]|nr:type I glutamate--ammonia ligase [Candidatus Neomarinimicrobiota bacterium]RKY48764.1 MAG: type I glutamate--ammonia ligase [Candidatus Neomarinimicrobiota bacterium]